MHRNHNRRLGFSLIEVNLAVLLVAVGLLSLFALFPFGLRESEMGLVDTHEAMFADAVLSAMEANAMTMTNWNTWSSENDFKTAVISNTYPLVQAGLVRKELGQGIQFPDPDHITPTPMPRFMRYELILKGGDGALRRQAHLRVKSGNYGKFDQNAQHYYTEFIYMGM